MMMMMMMISLYCDDDNGQSYNSWSGLPGLPDLPGLPSMPLGSQGCWAPEVTGLQSSIGSQVDWAPYDHCAMFASSESERSDHF